MVQPSVASRRRTVPVPLALPEAFNSRTGCPMVSTFFSVCQFAAGIGEAAVVASAIIAGAGLIAPVFAATALAGCIFAAITTAGLGWGQKILAGKEAMTANRDFAGSCATGMDRWDECWFCLGAALATITGDGCTVVATREFAASGFFSGA